MIGSSDLGGLGEGSNETREAILTDVRLWRSALVAGRLAFPTDLVAFGTHEPLQDRHHGVVAAAGTARGWAREVEPFRGLCFLGRR